LKRLLLNVSHFFAEISGWFLSIIMFLLVLNLVTRFAGMPIQGLLEMSTFVFLALIYLGLAHCEENDEHIKVRAVIKRVPMKFARGMNIFNYLLAIVIGSIITYAAGDTALDAFRSGESVPGTAPLPTYPVKIAIFIGTLAFVAFAILHLIKLFKKEEI